MKIKSPWTKDNKNNDINLEQKFDSRIDSEDLFDYKDDNIEYTSPQETEQTNKVYPDVMKTDTQHKDLTMQENEKRNELRNQIYSNPDYALNEAGFEFAKTIYEIDPELAKEIISVVTQAVQTGNFEQAKLNYKKLIESKSNVQEMMNKTK